MYKRIRILMVVMLTVIVSGLSAQQGEIIYTHFDPPMTLQWQFNSDTLTMDFDRDGSPDFGIAYIGYPWTPYLISLKPGWEYTINAVGDTLPLSSPDRWWRHDDGYISFSNGYTWGIRFVDGENCYYGWAFTDSYSEPNDPGVQYNKMFVAIYDMAFCTIPNYPLHWGQTTLTEGFEENETLVFATLHPNPATDIVAIIGNDLKAAEVINALGQRVAVANGRGGRLTVDIGSLPVGVYSVIVTDESGKKCVRKVVKE